MNNSFWTSHYHHYFTDVFFAFCKDGGIRRKLLVAAAPTDYKQPRRALRRLAPLPTSCSGAYCRVVGEEKEHDRDPYK